SVKIFGHVSSLVREIASPGLPLLARLHQQGTDESQERLLVREQSRHPRAPLQFLVHALETVGRTQTLPSGLTESEPGVEYVNPSAMATSIHSESFGAVSRYLVTISGGSPQRCPGCGR